MHSLFSHRYLIEIEMGYTGDSLYHCSGHAADVLRTLHVLCTRGGIWKEINCSDLGASHSQLLGLHTSLSREMRFESQGGAEKQLLILP